MNVKFVPIRAWLKKVIKDKIIINRQSTFWSDAVIVASISRQCQRRQLRRRCSSLGDELLGSPSGRILWGEDSASTFWQVCGCKSGIDPEEDIPFQDRDSFPSGSQRQRESYH
jgi:hypothetical protein